MSELPPDLEQFLARPPQVRPSDGLREDLLEQTSTLVVKRASKRRLRMFMVGWAIVIPCFVAFVLRQATFLPDRIAPEAIVVPRPPVEVIQVLPEPVSPPDAAELEWQAFDSPPEKRARLYWTAGQAYVATDGDYVSAVRCFRQALDVGPAELLQITDQDDVLTMALKTERTRKEKSDVVP